MTVADPDLELRDLEKPALPAFLPSVIFPKNSTTLMWLNEI